VTCRAGRSPGFRVALTFRSAFADAPLRPGSEDLRYCPALGLVESAEGKLTRVKSLKSLPA